MGGILRTALGLAATIAVLIAGMPAGAAASPVVLARVGGRSREVPPPQGPNDLFALSTLPGGELWAVSGPFIVHGEPA